MWELENRYYLFLLLLLPLFVIGYFVYRKWQKKAQQRFGSGNYLEKLAPNASSSKSALKFILLMMSVLFLIIALVNPKFGTQIETIERKGIDIVFAIDVSKSMLAEDVAPNRLEKAKHLTSKIIDNLASDRIGLVAYAGSAFPLLPITTDYSLAKMYLQDISTDMVSSVGTAFKDAIEVSAGFFDSKQASKLLVLVSDGEDHGENTQDVIAFAKEHKIKIVTIGLGSEQGAKIPVKENGKFLHFKKDSAGEDVVTRMNTSILKQIASETQGLYIYGKNAQDVLLELNKVLQRIEKKDIASQEISNYQSQFQWFLILSILCLAIEFFVFETKSQGVLKSLFQDKKIK